MTRSDKVMASEVRLEPIQSIPGYKRVAQEIEAQILSGRLRDGDLLPIENDLAIQLGVNRSTIREGIRALESAGLVRRASGKRLVVCAPDQADVTWNVCRALGLGRITFTELHEILMVLEPAAARLAASRLPDEIKAQLRANLQATEARLFDDDALVKLDDEFHRLVSRATGNRALVIAEEPIAMLLRTATDQLYRRSPRARFRLLEAHRHILEALEAGDADTAADWMRKHIDDFRRGYIVAGMDFKGPIKFGPAAKPS